MKKGNSIIAEVTPKHTVLWFLLTIATMQIEYTALKDYSALFVKNAHQEMFILREYPTKVRIS